MRITYPPWVTNTVDLTPRYLEVVVLQLVAGRMITEAATIVKYQPRRQPSFETSIQTCLRQQDVRIVRVLNPGSSKAPFGECKDGRRADQVG